MKDPFLRRRSGGEFFLRAPSQYSFPDNIVLPFLVVNYRRLPYTGSWGQACMKEKKEYSLLLHCILRVRLFKGNAFGKFKTNNDCPGFTSSKPKCFFWGKKNDFFVLQGRRKVETCIHHSFFFWCHSTNDANIQSSKRFPTIFAAFFCCIATASLSLRFRKYKKYKKGTFLAALCPNNLFVALKKCFSVPEG